MQIGFIAQEVGEIFPELLRTDEEGVHGLAYDDFGVLAIAAIQEQQTQIDQLAAENAQLRADIEEIRAAIGLPRQSPLTSSAPIFLLIALAGLALTRHQNKA